MGQYLICLPHKYEVLNLIIQKGRIENLGTELYGYNLNMVVMRTGRKHGTLFSRVQLSQKSGSSVTDSVYNKMEKN